VQEFPRGLIALACVTLAAAAAWYGALRRGPLRVAGLAAGVLGLAAAIVLLASDDPLEEVLIAAALVAGGACARAAFDVHVQLPRQPPPQRPGLFFAPARTWSSSCGPPSPTAPTGWRPGTDPDRSCRCSRPLR
jgi:peptidoglycan/LPS O-acetylase OafA/YrhL